MDTDTLDRLIGLLAVGGGLIAIGLTHLLFPKRGLRFRAIASFTAVGVVGGVLALADGNANSWYLAGGIGIPTLGCFALARASAGVRLAHFLRSPIVSSASLTAVGLALGVAALVHHERQQNANDGGMEVDYERINFKPPSSLAIDVHAFTDRGREVRLNEVVQPRTKSDIETEEMIVLATLGRGNATIRSKPARDGTNCHGWVFASGEYLVSGETVETIVRENEYRATATPQPGDLVVYRDSNNAVSHTALVRYVTPGQPVLAEGKWGWMGVYLHDVEQSCYGTNYTYYRSPRRGHTLHGLDGHTLHSPSVK